MQRHPEKLVAKAKKCKAYLSDVPGIIEIESPSGSTYFVRIGASPSDERSVDYICGCKWNEYHPGKMCSHKIAAEMFLANSCAEYVSFWSEKIDALRQHRIIVRVQDLFMTVRRAV